MTKEVESAIEALKRDIHNAKLSGYQTYHYEMAIKALEQEPTIEYVQKIDKSAMMHEIYMAGVNMADEYQGCWVRFKEIEKIVDRYVR